MDDKVVLSLKSYHKLSDMVDGLKVQNRNLDNEVKRIKGLLATVLMDNGGILTLRPESFSKMDFVMNTEWFIQTRPQPTDEGIELILSLHDVN